MEFVTVDETSKGARTEWPFLAPLLNVTLIFAADFFSSSTFFA